MYQRYITFPKQSFFLFGPRGCGKSTWIRHCFSNAIWIDLLNPDELRYYAAWPERLKATILGSYPHKKIIVIDEVQRAPELLSVIHFMIEEKMNLQFILTGSSSRKLKRSGANLLAGRALMLHMHPFMASELGRDFSLKKALQIGLLPIIWQSPSPEATLKTYVSLYLKEEVQEEGLIRKVGDFARFLEIISFSHASIINTTNIARECDIARKTANNYVEILEDLLLAFKIPIFTKRAKRALSIHPKFYLFDAGIFRSLRPKGILDTQDEMEGAALEGLVAGHLKAWVFSQEEEHLLAFWRTRSGLEVDFIIYGPRGFWAIEVKHSSRLHPRDTKALESFYIDYPECHPILLYTGDKIIKQKNILCIPCEEFLQNLHPKNNLEQAFINS